LPTEEPPGGRTCPRCGAALTSETTAIHERTAAVTETKPGSPHQLAEDDAEDDKPVPNIRRGSRPVRWVLWALLALFAPWTLLILWASKYQKDGRPLGLMAASSFLGVVSVLVLGQLTHWIKHQDTTSFGPMFFKGVLGFLAFGALVFAALVFFFLACTSSI
jgi:hypothetical protein